MAEELTELSALHGFADGDINTDGYLAVIPAYQKVYLADGRDFDDKGYHKIDHINTKVVGTSDAALTNGEPVTQATSGAKGFYDECTDVKLAGAITVASVPFQLGEKVTQLVTLAEGYVVYVGSGFINVCTISRNNSTGVVIPFTASVNDVTGVTSGAVMATVDTVSTDGTDRFHYIYRTTTTEFDQDNAITGGISGSILTPLTAADGSPDLGACIQHFYPDASGSDGTFTVTYEGETTAAIAYNASTATITTAIDLLSTVTAGDIVVSGTTFDSGNSTTPLIFTFLSTLGSVNGATITESMGTTTSVTTKILQTGFTTITAPPHWLTWKPQAPGIFPDGGSNVGCLCFGRVFLNSMNNPHQWFYSRTAKPTDWDAAQTDVAAAGSSQSAKAGEVGNPIIATVGYKDYFLIFGCASEVWILRSDPLQGGVLTAVSKVTGFFSPTSWCWDDDNNLYFLGLDGIYMLTAEAIINAQPPKNITKKNVPKLVQRMGLNRRTDRVAMEYDKERYGIEISISAKDGDWSTNFWLDLRTGGVFPDAFPNRQHSASMLYYDPYKSSSRALLMGGYDGWIRKYDDTEKNDEGSNAIDSFVNLGPIASTREPRMRVETNETSLVLGEDSDGVTIDIYTGDSADNLVSTVIAGTNTPLATKVLTGDGLRNSIRNRVSGKAISHKISNSNADETWSMEDINMKLKESGRKKV